MAENKHYIKVYYTDEEGTLISCDGTTSTAADIEELDKTIGRDIRSEMIKAIKERDEAIYGFRIDYKLTPIKTDPFS